MLTPSLQIQHVSSFVFASTFEENEDIFMPVATTVDMIIDIVLRHQLLFCSFNNGFPSFTSQDSTQNVCIRFKLLQPLKKTNIFLLFGIQVDANFVSCLQRNNFQISFLCSVDVSADIFFGFKSEEEYWHCYCHHTCNS